MAESSTLVAVEMERISQINLQDPVEIPWNEVRCEPVIDFLHAQVFTPDNNNNNNHPLEVYGKINLIDYTSSIFPLYDRDECDRLYPGNYLQLSGPQDIPTLNYPVVFVDIKNVDTGDVIAYGVQNLPKTTQNDDIEQLYTLRFEGSGSSSISHVDLQCVAFTFGVYAEVRVYLYKDSAQNVNEEEGVEIFGLVSAQCNAKHKYKNNLFNVVKQDHEWVGYGCEILLSKYLVAVPAYSELEISIDLRVSEDAGFDDDGISVKGTVCFQPCNTHAGLVDVPGGNGYFVRLDVTWQNPSLLNKHYCRKDYIGAFCSLPRWRGLYATNLLEVFSLFISRPDGKEVNLHGSVSIYYFGVCCNIFTCSKEQAYFLPRGCNLLPMQGPQQVVATGRTFSIEVDLTDVDGHFKIKGSATSSFGIEERQKPWYDRRLYSVVKNEKEKSFVAINYTLFAYAVLAIVKIHVSVEPDCFFKIYGDIIASCSKLPYSTSYDKEFFRRVLFTRKEANALGGQGCIELSRNYVAVPMTSSLVAEVDMYIQIVGDTYHARKRVAFEIGGPQTLKVASDGDVGKICFDVEWKVFPLHKSPDWETSDTTDC